MSQLDKPIFLCSHHGPLTDARLPQCPYCYDALVAKYESLLEKLRAIQQSPQYQAIRTALEQR